MQLYCTVLSLKDIETKFRWYFSNSFFQDEDNQGALINRTLFKSHLETSPNSDSSRLKWKLVLNLKNLSVADTGSYSCQAENFAGTDQRETYLNVTTRLITPSKGKKRLSEHAGAKGLRYIRKLLEDSLLKELGNDREWIGSTEVSILSGRYGIQTVLAMQSLHSRLCNWSIIMSGM